MWKISVTMGLFTALSRSSSRRAGRALISIRCTLREARGRLMSDEEMLWKMKMLRVSGVPILEVLVKHEVVSEQLVSVIG